MFLTIRHVFWPSIVYLNAIPAQLHIQTINDDGPFFVNTSTSPLASVHATISSYPLDPASLLIQSIHYFQFLDRSFDWRKGNQLLQHDRSFLLDLLGLKPREDILLNLRGFEFI